MSTAMLLAPILLPFAISGAAPTQIHNANLITETASIDAIGTARDGWYAFPIPLIRPQSSCCYEQRGGETAAGCRLDGRHASFSAMSLPDSTSSYAHVYAEFREGDLTQMHTFGTACPIDAGGATVRWIDEVQGQSSLDWLGEQMVNGSKNVRQSAMHAVAVHAEPGATDLLYQTAEQGRRSDAQTAVFWLGEARGGAGASALVALLDRLPTGDTRRQINFALSQNDTPEAADKLVEISRTDADREQRADALFWLAESDHPEALTRITEAVFAEADRAMADRAIFALSQLGSPEARETLKRVISSHPDTETKGQALFWLAQQFPEYAGHAISQILDSNQADALKEKAVFALSQLPHHESTVALLDVLNGDYSRGVRRQAMFWLAQSDDPRALEELERALAR